MEESFLHFIWKFQYFDNRNLKSDSGKSITIINPGHSNSDAGPDFEDSKIKIDDIVWNGNIEIHVNAKDWYRHGHDKNEAYDSVILHAVWNNDASVIRKDETIIPTLELKGLIDESLFRNYKRLFQPGHEILCEPFVSDRNQILILNMCEKTLAQRLEKKAGRILRDVALLYGDWEEITWRLVCKNFCFKTNTFAFSELAKSIPFKILKKEAHQFTTIEALLFGQAGFLEKDIDDEYFEKLKREYLFMQKKYQLERRVDEHQWKFLRLRPANFPTIRLSQLAGMISQHKNLFSFFTGYSSAGELSRKLEGKQSSYWRKHYKFGRSSKTVIGGLGSSSISNILINTVAPLIFAYSLHKGEEYLKEKSLKLLESVRAESNSITKKWKDLGIEFKSAFDSQALIELYNEYCLRKRCLNCMIGVDIVKSC